MPKAAGTPELRAFKSDEDLGLAVIRALSGEQRNKAIIAAEPGGEVFTSAFRDNLELNYAGIRYDDLSTRSTICCFGWLSCMSEGCGPVMPR